ncbi:MAG: GDSL-type esterase/lipase family protein [Myxococcota bacterium]
MLETDEAGRPPQPWREVFLSRPALAALAVVAFGVVAELVPQLAPLRILSPRPTPEAATAPAALPAPAETGEAELVQRTEQNSGVEAAAVPRAQVSLGNDPPPKVKLESADPKALDAFFRALEATRQKRPEAITRIVHFGDSIVASDYVSGTLRRLLQARFGDAGHGFTLVANAWPAYFHNDVERYATAGWKVSRVVGPLSEDGFYGLGCVSFRAEKNVLSRIGTAKSGDFGRHVSRFGISYLAAPDGGTFQVSVDGVVLGLVDTRAAAKEARVHELKVPDGPHEIEILTKSGASRLFGVILERDVPGVVLDAIGIQGARVRFLDKQDDAHWAEQLAARRPNLLVYQFGANESADGILYPMVDYHRTMKEVLEQGKRAVPNASCLVVGVMDRATKQGEELRSVRIIPRLLQEQRAVAAEVGCAFFDTHRAMGGEGSMPSWVKRGLGQADLTHPSSIGADMIGTWIFRALMQRYGEFLNAETGSTGGAPNSAPSVNSPSLR